MGTSAYDSILGHRAGSLRKVFLAIPSPLMSGDSLEVRDSTMPQGINPIHLKERFQHPQFLVSHKGHGNA